MALFSTKKMVKRKGSEIWMQDYNRELGVWKQQRGARKIKDEFRRGKKERYDPIAGSCTSSP
jgi:hypothetical protein